MTALAVVLLSSGAPDAAHAQQVNPQALVQQLQNNPTQMAQQQAAAFLQGQGVAGGQANNIVSGLTQGFANGSLNLNNATSLFTGVANQQITGTVGQQLAQIPGLGNLAGGQANAIVGNLVQGAISGNLNMNTIGNLAGGLVSNQIGGALGQQLSQIPGLGNLAGGQANAIVGNLVQSAISGNLNMNTIGNLAGGLIGGQIGGTLGQQLSQIPGLNNLAGGQAGAIVGNLVQGAMSGNMNIASIGNLAGSLIGGQIGGTMAQGLANIPNLGNLNPGQMASAMAGSGVQGAIASALGAGGGPISAAQAQGAVASAMTAMNIAGNGNVQQALATAGAAAVANLINQAFPQLGQMLGGITGLTNILGGAMGVVTGGGSNDPNPGATGGCNCIPAIAQHHETIRTHMTNKRKEHEVWLVSEFFIKHVAPALMLMTEQLTTAGMQQVQIIGSFFDAKHQLETQRLLQQMTAQAHKDYQPSEELCTIGTSIRSLAGSERAASLARSVVSTRMMQRQLLNADNLSGADPLAKSDRNARFDSFIKHFCDPKDHSGRLEKICKTAAPADYVNSDIDYLRTLENKLTLDMDFHTKGEDNKNPSDDERAVFALGANLYAHEVLPYIDRTNLVPLDKDPRFDSEQYLMTARRIAALRSLALNSYAARVGMRASGTPEAQPYLYKIVEELGVPQKDIEKLLGKNPSYLAQMTILTKNALQNPAFYTALYDKPVNVERKGVTLLAARLMLGRDIYESLIRSELMTAAMVDVMLTQEQERIAGEIERLGRGSAPPMQQGGN